jgi:dTMP kinase
MLVSELKTKPKPLFVTFSAIDGAGKSTQVENLKAYYQHYGFVPICLWTRGGYTPIFNTLKDIARRIAGEKLPSSGPSKQRDEYLQRTWIRKLWLTIAILDLAWVYVIRVRWWLLRGRLVLCDRYMWDTLIDFKLMFPDIQVEEWLLWKILVRLTPRPDVAFLLTIPLEESERRCQMKYEPFPDTPERREQRCWLYQELSKLGHWHVVDASRPVADVFAEIVAIVCKVPSGHGTAAGFQTQEAGSE